MWKGFIQVNTLHINTFKISLAHNLRHRPHPFVIRGGGQIYQAELFEAHAFLIARQLMWHSPAYK